MMRWGMPPPPRTPGPPVTNIRGSPCEVRTVGTVAEFAIDLAVVVNGTIVPIKPVLFPKKGTGEHLPTPSAKDSDDYEHARVKNRGRIRVLV
jgi:hypothetical protein